MTMSCWNTHLQPSFVVLLPSRLTVQCFNSCTAGTAVALANKPSGAILHLLQNSIGALRYADGASLRIVTCYVQCIELLLHGDGSHGKSGYADSATNIQ